MTEEHTQLKLSFTTEDLNRATSVVSLSSSGISEADQSILPDVAFVPGSNSGTIDSQRTRENQPLLGRGDADSFNIFPGKESRLN